MAVRPRSLIILAALTLSIGCTVPANQLPNIVLIISDDQGWMDYGFMGHPVIHTPHLDRLARESIVFRRGYVPTALCRPSLMTLATGHYAHRHGVTGNDPSPRHAARESALFRECRATLISYIDRFETLPELLGERGYLSHQSGKWWEGSFRRGGFTHGMTRGFPEEGGRHGDAGLKIGREGLSPITDFVDLAIGERSLSFSGMPLFYRTHHTIPRSDCSRSINRRDGHRPLPTTTPCANGWTKPLLSKLAEIRSSTL